LVDSIRDDVYIEMMNRISDPSLLEDPAGFEKEIDFLKERLGLIENTLEVRGEVTIDLEIEKDIIIASFNEYGNSLIEANRRLSESGLLSAISDDDQDGLSDFTEEIITLTDKTKKSTIGGPSTDAESLLLGKNASDLDLEDTVYVDISKNSSGAYLSLSRVDYVEQKKSVNNDTGNVFLRGLSVPASVVYGYIYPENIVFVTQTDRLGLWEHALTRSLEDGEYVVQLAHLEANGNPITRSKSFNFIHEGGSTYLEGQPIVSVTLPQTGGRDPFLGGVSNGGSLSESPFMAQGPLAEFIREYFLIIVGGLAVLGVLVSFILVKSGMHRRAGTYYSAMSSDGPTINQAGGRSLYGSLNTSAAQAEG